VFFDIFLKNQRQKWFFVLCKRLFPGFSEKIALYKPKLTKIAPFFLFVLHSLWKTVWKTNEEIGFLDWKTLWKTLWENGPEKCN